jgi:long-chain acyl-CoA synthetase
MAEADSAQIDTVYKESTISEMIAATLTSAPDEHFIEHNNKQFNRGWIKNFGDGIVRALDAAGVPPQIRVGIVARNSEQQIAALLALVAANRSVAMIYSSQSEARLAGELEAGTIGVLLASAIDWTPKVIESASSRGVVGICFEAEVGGGWQILQGCEKFGVGNDALTAYPAIEVLSSGTTGPPKRIPLRYKQLTRVVMASLSYVAEDEMPEQRTDIFCWTLGGMTGVWILVIAAALGRRLVLMDRFRIVQYFEYVEKLQLKTIGLLPVAFRMMLDTPIPVSAVASVEVIRTGGGYVDPDILDEVESRYNVIVLDGYGATEFSGAVIAWSLLDRRKWGNRKRGSMGRPLSGIEVRIVDPITGAEVPRGEQGLIEVFALAIRPDRVRTNDLAVMDVDDFVYFKGRFDGAFSRGGFKLVPDAIASVLRQHPALAEACVVGVHDGRLGHVPVAVLEVRKGVDSPSTDELEKFSREHLLAQHVPVKFIVVEALPRTESLKVSIKEVEKIANA